MISRLYNFLLLLLLLLLLVFPALTTTGIRCGRPPERGPGDFASSRIRKAQILSAGGYSVVEEPHACYAFHSSKDALRGHPHNPLNELRYLYPPNYFDRNLNIVTWDILLREVAVLEQGVRKTLPRVLIRHYAYHDKPVEDLARLRGVTENNCHLNYMSALILQQNRDCLNQEKFVTRHLLWYREQPEPLSLYTRRRGDGAVPVHAGFGILYVKVTHRQEGGADETVR